MSELKGSDKSTGCMIATGVPAFNRLGLSPKFINRQAVRDYLGVTRTLAADINLCCIG